MNLIKTKLHNKMQEELLANILCVRVYVVDLNLLATLIMAPQLSDQKRFGSFPNSGNRIRKLREVNDMSRPSGCMWQGHLY